MPQHAERITIVTGASRGVGADIAVHLAEHSGQTGHVVVHYRGHASDAERTARRVRSAGTEASTLAADLSDPTCATAMIDEIGARFGRLDTLVLTACGGAEPGADPATAMRVNRDAQKRLVTRAIPLMPPGSRIVFVTNHQAHFFPHKAVPKGHAAIAAGLRAGETALYAMRPAFDRAGIGFTVVSAGRLGTPGLAASVTSAVAQAATARHSPGVVYVGGADYLMTA